MPGPLADRGPVRADDQLAGGVALAAPGDARRVAWRQGPRLFLAAATGPTPPLALDWPNGPRFAVGAQARRRAVVEDRRGGWMRCCTRHYGSWAHGHQRRQASRGLPARARGGREQAVHEPLALCAVSRRAAEARRSKVRVAQGAGPRRFDGRRGGRGGGIRSWAGRRRNWARPATAPRGPAKSVAR